MSCDVVCADELISSQHVVMGKVILHDSIPICPIGCGWRPIAQPLTSRAQQTKTKSILAAWEFGRDIFVVEQCFSARLLPRRLVDSWAVAFFVLERLAFDLNNSYIWRAP
jgi:hypothetical protein